MNNAFFFFSVPSEAGYNFFEKKNRTWSFLTSDQVVLSSQVVLFPPFTFQWEKALESLRTRPVGYLSLPNV